MLAICCSTTRPYCLPILLASLFITGCSTTTTQSFNVVKDSKVETSLIAVGADFSKYDRLDAEEMGIFFPADAAPSVQDQERIRQIFREAFLSRLDGYEVVQGQDGPTTLRVQATLVDFRNASAKDIMSVRRELRDMAKPGVLMFLMELKDSRTGDVLARAADSAAAPTFSTSAGVPTDWTAVEEAAAHWAGLFRQFVDENLNK
jgi:hypothetical protein